MISDTKLAFENFMKKTVDDKSFDISMKDDLQIETIVYLAFQSYGKIIPLCAKISSVTFQESDSTFEIETTTGVYIGKYNFSAFNIDKSKQSDSIQKIFLNKSNLEKYLENLYYIKQVEAEEFLSLLSKKSTK
jgi:hypothetical protein